MFDHIGPMTSEEIYANVATVFGYVMVGLTAIVVGKVKEIFDKRKIRRGCVKENRASVVMNNFLNEARILTEADRVIVAQFHNGDHFASGASIQRVSLTHFSIRTGIEAPQTSGDALQNTPASFMASLLSDIFTVGFVVVKEFEAGDVWLARYLAAAGLRTSVICFIPGSHPKEAYGFMAFSWLDPTDVTPEMTRKFVDYAKQASAYL